MKKLPQQEALPTVLVICKSWHTAVLDALAATGEVTAAILSNSHGHSTQHSFRAWLRSHGRQLTNLRIHQAVPRWPSRATALALECCSNLQSLRITLQFPLAQECINCTSQLKQLTSLSLYRISPAASLSRLPTSLHNLHIMYRADCGGTWGGPVHDVQGLMYRASPHEALHMRGCL